MDLPLSFVSPEDFAHEHTAQVHQNTVNEHGIVMFGHQDIAALAHSLWQTRGCPDGWPDEDWFRASQRTAKPRGRPQRVTPNPDTAAMQGCW